MAGQRTIGNVEAGSQLVHIHIVVLKKKIQDVYAHIGAERLKKLESFGERCNV